MIWLCPLHQGSLQRCLSGDTMMVLCDGSNVCNVLTHPCVLSHMYAAASFSSTVMVLHIMAGFAWVIPCCSWHSSSMPWSTETLVGTFYMSSDGTIIQCSRGHKTHVSPQCCIYHWGLSVSFLYKFSLKIINDKEFRMSVTKKQCQSCKMVIFYSQL